MIQMMKRDFQLSLFCCCLGKLTMASWLLTNTMFLLASHVPFVTLDFVRQISLESFLGIWLGIFLCMAIPYVLPCGRSRIHFSLTPSVLMYIATLMIKETFILVLRLLSFYLLSGSSHYLANINFFPSHP